MYLLKREKTALNYILTGAKLVAPALNPVSAGSVLGQLLRESVVRYACWTVFIVVIASASVGVNGS